MAQSRLIQAASCRASATANVRAKENRTNSEATVADAGGRISGNNTATGIELANSQPCSRFSSEGRGTHAKGSKHNEQAAFLNVVLSMVKDKDLEYITFDDGKIDTRDDGAIRHVHEQLPKDSDLNPKLRLRDIYARFVCVVFAPLPLQCLLELHCLRLIAEC